MIDTSILGPVITGLSHLIIESNFADDTLKENIRNGSVHPSTHPRLMQTHLEIRTTINILTTNDLTEVINMVLCHLSSCYSDEKRFIREVWEAIEKSVYAAKMGMDIYFNKQPY